VTEDPGGVDQAAKTGNLSIRIGVGWAKSHAFTTGQCPVMRYHRQLMHAILHEKFHPAKCSEMALSGWSCTRLSGEARVLGRRTRWLAFWVGPTSPFAV
jgi:hypothetical protein